MSDLTARIMAFVVPLLPGFLAGFVIGRIAKNALSKALIVAAGVAVLLFLLGRFGLDTSTVTEWLQLGSSWAGEQLEGATQYLAAILPTAAAVGVGFKVGLGRRRRG